MLYLIYGEDTYRARKNAREIVKNLAGRDPDAVVHRLNSENASEEKLADLVSGQNLFGRKSVVVLDGLLESDFEKFLCAHAKEMSASPDVYIVLEEKLEAKLAKKISKFAQKTCKFAKLSSGDFEKWMKNEAKTRGAEISPAEISFLIQTSGTNLWAASQFLELKGLGGEAGFKSFVYNSFELADLFASKKPREAYFCFHKNLSEGVSAEEMFWKIWWQVKTLLGVSSHKEYGLNNFQIKQKTGLHPYIVQKSLSALSRFGRKDLEKIWNEMFSLWRGSRLGENDLKSGLSAILLRLGLSDKFG